LRRPAFTRVILLVIDSAGIGELPDAGVYGDEGSNTVGNIAAQVGLAVPCLRSLGLGRVVALDSVQPGSNLSPRGAFGRMAEASPGKDSVTGHWEMAGVVLDRPFPTFPGGFSAETIAEFERRIGRGSLGNVVASGTEIIARLGDEHVRTGKPIVYTSADSVFQVAAHEDVIPIASSTGSARPPSTSWGSAWASAGSSPGRSSVRLAPTSARRTATTTRSNPPAPHSSMR